MVAKYFFEHFFELLQHDEYSKVTQMLEVPKTYSIDASYPILSSLFTAELVTVGRVTTVPEAKMLFFLFAHFLFLISALFSKCQMKEGAKC